jgi:hypothetical protein
MAGSPYCSIPDVAALNWARAIGVASNPGNSQVQTYINMVAGEIDAVLIRHGYLVPVNIASYPDAARMLNTVNAKGAVWMMEEASPSSPNLDRAKAAYDAAMKMLADAQFVMNAAMDTTRSEPRAPWITYQPTGDTYDPQLENLGGYSGDGISSGGRNQRSNPYFSRSQQF